jgi:DNA-binding MarR family transcriptional regulator
MVHVKYRSTVWRSLIDLLRAQKFWLNAIAEDFDLTPQMAQALNEIPPTGSITMKELATLMWCDASNVTGVVDRLEDRNLVERRPAEHDRRMKCVALTTAGKRLRRKLDERMSQLPPAVAALCDADQRNLGEILERALENAHRQRSERES